jgi:hypothetical protein
MPFVNGVFVPRVPPNTQPTSNSNDNLNSYRAPEPIGEEEIPDGLFTTSLLNSKFVAGSFTASVLKRLIPDGVFSVANGMRTLFTSGFVSRSMIASDAISGSKISNPIKVALVDGGSAGAHTVAGIRTGDELISVLEQNGTSGLLTDLTTEFAIASSDTITNSGGTDTSGDKLLVLYLDKTTDLTLVTLTV